MKLVISMSFGVDYPNEFAGLAIKNLTAERKDVLWLASAGGMVPRMWHIRDCTLVWHVVA